MAGNPPVAFREPPLVEGKGEPRCLSLVLSILSHRLRRGEPAENADMRRKVLQLVGPCRINKGDQLMVMALQQELTALQEQQG